MEELTEIERNDLAKICAMPLSGHRRRLKFQLFYAIGGFVVLVVGLLWLKMNRSPTVVQAMIFSAFVVLSSSLGYIITSVLDYRHIKMIHYLNAELQNANAANSKQSLDN